jgi:hypothetical protein
MNKNESLETDDPLQHPVHPESELPAESLTDLIDRLDRMAFQRSLQSRGFSRSSREPDGD